MKILSLEYEDKSRGWKLEKTTFGDLTLLVGASGVGKTQILRAITVLDEIAQGKYSLSDNLLQFTGISWDVEFYIVGKGTYQWSGEYENFEIAPEAKSHGLTNGSRQYHSGPILLSEKITLGGITLVERNDEVVIFNGQRSLVKLPSEASVLDSLNAEEEINIIKKHLRRIKPYFFMEHERPNQDSVINQVADYDSLQKIRESELGIKQKLHLCSSVALPTFEDIKYQFLNIFPFVKDLMVEEKPAHASYDWHSYRIKIKEVGLDYWIEEEDMSHGMYLTLLQLAELYLCSDGTVFLIDEFENGLGINCIDEVVTAILTSTRDLQFILTSHHPYIINNISYNHWKLVTRYGGVVTTHDAEEFNLGKSKHKAFIQLSNLDAFIDGVTS